MAMRPNSPRGNQADTSRTPHGGHLRRCCCLLVRRRVRPSALLTAPALVLVIEGLVLAVFADRLAVLLARLAEIPPEALRAAGLVSAVLGLFAVWLIRG